MEPANRVLRRRGAGQDGSSTNPNHNNNNSNAGSIPGTPRPRNVSSELSHEQTENGHKIAFDPKDLSERSERERLPKMTLMEEVVLLGIKDQEGYLSFWNDSISYTLRACLMIELALRGRIRADKDSRHTSGELADRVLVEVVDDTLTGEALLDEAMKRIKTRDEKTSVRDWIDMFSGETWSLLSADYQLKQVRERVAKSLTDKGILRTGKSSFLIFDMTTHPLADAAAKNELVKRVQHTLMSRTVTLPNSAHFPDTLGLRYFRTVLLVCAAHSASVLESAFTALPESSQRDAADRVEGLLQDYAQWPFGKSSQGYTTGVNLGEMVAAELGATSLKDSHFQVIAACLDVLLKCE